MKMQLIKEMAAEFSPAALGEIADAAKARQKLIEQYVEPETDDDVREAAKAFGALAAACEAIIAIGRAA